MGFGLILAGMFFLINPNVNIVDIFPDFIGCLLILGGLKKISMIADAASVARDAFFKLVIIEIAKFLSIIFLPQSDDTLILVMVFSFAVIEAMYALPAINQLFEDFYALGMRYSADSVYFKRTRRVPVRGVFDDNGKRVYHDVKIERAEGLKIFTCFFIILKLILAILPELPALQLYEYIGAVSATTVNYTAYKPLFYLASWTVETVFAIIWFVSMAKYLRGMMKDGGLIGGIREEYEKKVLPRRGLFIARRMKTVLLYFGIASVTLLNVYVDGMPAVPNFIPALMIALAMLYLIKETKLAFVGLASSVAWAAMSTVSLVFSSRFYEEYETEAVMWITAAAKQYATVEVLSIVEYTVGGIALLGSIAVLYLTVRRHTVTLGRDTGHLMYSREQRNRETVRGFTARTAVSAVFALIATVMNGAYVKLVVELAELWILNFTVTLVFIGVFIGMLSYAYKYVYDRMQDEA